MYCKKCGNKNEKGFAFCSKCGEPLNEEQEVKTKSTKKTQEVPVQEIVYDYQPVPQYYMNNRNETGTGLSTAALVIGIIVAFVFTFELFGFIFISSIENISIDEAEYAYLSALVFELIPFIFSIVGLSLSIAGVVKYKNGRSITGLILSIISIIESIVLFILLLNIVD